ncbi:MAG: FISUMP domain-containing protein [Bacteroidales bacterium]|nr:FISUMP domain-containing protein [Bacteroidales bacterium]
MIKQFLLVYLLLLFSCEKLFSQIDNQFWFVAPDISATHGDNPIFIRLSSMSDPVNFQLTMPADQTFTPISGSIGPNATFSIPLTAFKNQIENSPANNVNTKGLKLTTDNLVTAYYEEANESNPGIFSLKGQNALGYEFYIISQNGYNNFPYNDAYETFEIVATQDNTTITITPTDDIIGHDANSTFTITLNQGETYSARSIHQEAARTLAGSHIVSDKPIAITWADDSIQTGGWDVAGDQIVPVSIIGNEYIAIKGDATNTPTENAERVYIVGVTDNTTLNIDGAFVQTINAGQFFSYPIPTSSPTAYIQASNPVYVMHLSGYPGEAGASLLPQIFCTGSRQIGFFRTSTNSFALMILTLEGNQGAFSMDGSSTTIQASDFSTVPGTGGQWVYTRKEMSPASLAVGSHLLTNSLGKFHLGILNKLGGSAEYGYFSYFSSINLGTDQSICPGSSTTLNGGEGWTTYLWEKEAGSTWTPVGGNTQTLVVSDPGHYRCSVTGQNCSLQDDINIYLYPVSEPLITGDASVCENETNVPYSATPNFAPYTWSVTGGTITSGQGSPTILVDWNATGSQTLSLNCVNQYNCPVQISYPVIVNPLPIVTLNLTPTCENTPAYSLTGGTPAGGVYSGTGVVNGTFDPSIAGVGSIPITYTYTDANGCINSTIQNLIVNPAPVVVFSSLSPVCISLPTLVLTGGSPTLGVYSGTGVNSGTGTFTPALAPTGSLITYTFTNSEGCSSIAQQFQQVLPIPSTQGTLSGDNAVCQADQESSYSLQNPDPLAITFSWTLSPAFAGNVVGTGPSCIVNWSDNFSGNVQLMFQVSSNCGSSGLSSPFNILVKPTPTVTLLECNDLKTTKNGKPIVLKGGLPLGSAGVYEGIGVHESPIGSGIYVFDPSDNQVNPLVLGAPYSITYRYTNNQGCDATASEEIKVYPSNAIQPCQSSLLTDIRDGQTYATFLSGSGASAKCWMSKNLNYGTPINGTLVQTDNCMVEKYCTNNSFAQCENSGGSYQWNELMQYASVEGSQGLCPPGWHVPTKAEWELLLSNNEGTSLAGGFLKESGTAYGFHGLPSGIIFFNQGWSFTTTPVISSMFWTSHQISAGSALANGLNSINPSVSSYLSSKANAFSVRCVKD